MDVFGTPIERGTLVSVTAGGARVASIDRPGIVTMPLQPLFRKAMEVGWPVFFMEYEDGSGVIISHQNPEVTREQGAIHFASFDLVNGCLMVTNIEPEFTIDENGYLEVKV
jgi:hypothetical protein